MSNNYFHSFYKTVSGGEGNRCHYPTRLDTYGCGCSHDCSYCYAKSLLSFRGLWKPNSPKYVDIEEVEKKIKKIPKGTILRLGGMTDCFQPLEVSKKVTYETIKLLNKYGIGYLIVTKSALCADDEYIRIYDKKLAHIQVTVTTLDDKLSLTYEKASVPSERIDAILKLQKLGFDVQIRLSPLMEEYMDFDKLNNLGIKRGIVEFLRVNTWIKKWFNIDYSKYIIKDGGYYHLPLNDKIKLLNKIKDIELSVCEDNKECYDYFINNFNPNKDDCCNLIK